MIQALRSLSLAAVLIAASCGALADDSSAEAQQWLERMSAAMNRLTYQGTFVYVRGDQMETMRITHVAGEDGVRERMYSVTGPQREIIRDSEGVRCILSDEESVMEDAFVSGAIFPEFPLKDLAGENPAYRFETGGTARIAGRMGRRVTIVPEDEFRYGYDLWLEADSGLLLKWVLFDTNRKSLAKLVFTDLRTGKDVDPAELESEAPAEAFTRLPSRLPPQQVMTRELPQWQPDSLPPGFRLATHRHRSDGEGVFEHLVYSDGLASVSVYIESPSDNNRMNPGLSRIGTANAFTRSLGDRQVTVIGEVPVATVRAIGDAFKTTAESR